jgi:hypothetical protein
MYEPKDIDRSSHKRNNGDYTKLPYARDVCGAFFPSAEGYDNQNHCRPANPSRSSNEVWYPDDKGPL